MLVSAEIETQERAERAIGYARDCSRQAGEPAELCVRTSI